MAGPEMFSRELTELYSWNSAQILLLYPVSPGAQDSNLHCLPLLCCVNTFLVVARCLALNYFLVVDCMLAIFKLLSVSDHLLSFSYFLKGSYYNARHVEYIFKIFVVILIIWCDTDKLIEDIFTEIHLYYLVTHKSFHLIHFLKWHFLDLLSFSY